MARILLLLPVLTLCVFLGLLHRRYSRDRKHWDIPFRDDHERPPGESLRLKLEELNDKLIPETHGLDAAVTRAKGLQEWLTSAVGEPVAVQPILALPGWYVDRTGRSSLPVMNPKTIPNFISKAAPRPLSGQRIKQIRHHLFEKNKVEAKR